MDKALQNTPKDQFVFDKVYTRDTTFIMQEIWSFGCADGVLKVLSWRNPYLPGVIHYLNQGSIEIWENLKATGWLEDTLLAENTNDPSFIDRTLATYREKLAPLHLLWDKKVLSLPELKELIELSKEAIVYFILYYYSAVDERTPAEIRKKALEMRNHDEFFARNDATIRASLVALFPHIRGYETAMFHTELDAIPSLDVLKERARNTVLVQGKQHYVTTLDAFSMAHPEFVFKKDVVPNVSEIRGNSAQRGKVIGKVFVLRRRDQVSQVKKGDVIVSPMTTPDFLPAMQNAVAFVTDEGGITCHAAIVARELKKPCVIGTKIATQIFKDGDIVEVDADNGVVRILQPDLEAYKRRDWVNVSKGHWSFLSCTDFISCYTHDLQIEGEHPFYHPVQVCSGDASELWFLKSELDAFGERIKHINTPEKITELLSNVARTGTEALSYIRNSKAESFDSARYRTLWEKIRDYYQYHLVVKYLGEYLSKEDLEKYASSLKDACVQYGEPIFNESEKLAKQIIESLGLKTGVSKDLLAFLTRDELDMYYAQRLLPAVEELEQRRTKSLIIGSPEGYRWVTGEDAKLLESYLYGASEHTAEKIVGSSAFKGKVTGTARVVGDPRTAVFNEGDILVTGMTHVDYLPLVQKSSAIVTDAGGILSHAAIIARELKKPCVIGTKNATKLIKDGQKIQVDADIGVITFIT